MVGFVLQHKEKFKLRENVGLVVGCVLQYKETRLSFEVFSMGKTFFDKGAAFWQIFNAVGPWLSPG